MCRVWAHSSLVKLFAKLSFILILLVLSFCFSQVLASGGSPPPPPPVAPTMTPAGEISQNSVVVTLSTPTSGAHIRYTTNGSNPTQYSTYYTGPITLNGNVTLKASTITSRSTPGGIIYTVTGPTSGIFSFDTAQPNYDVLGGSFSSPQTVSLTSATNGATIHCTIDGTTPTTSSPVCTSLNITESTVVKAFATKSGYNTSDVIEQTYNITSQLAVPTITPNGGTHNNSVQVHLYTPDSGATIYYTKDGTTPNVNSFNYTQTGSFSINTAGSTTIKAISISPGYESSDVASRTFAVESSANACPADYGSVPIANRITTPTESDSSVGSIAGQHSVGTTGVATYSIPLNVLPGTAGVEPKLSLEYMSGSGNSIFGLGFQLSGLSSIARCGTTIVDDGEFGSADLDVNDKFCIDGARLLAINGGTYGADETEYRTQINSFNKIVSYGTTGTGPEKFKVWTKSGEILEYGYTTDSVVTVSGEIVSWSLNKLKDTAGNALNVIYNYDSSTYEQKPWRIEYTENDGPAALDANQYVEFVYESRTDDVSSIAGTTVLSTNERVTQIKIGEGITDRKLYKFTYKDPYDDASLLEQIDECFIDNAGAEHCVRPTVFEWDEPTGDLQLGASEDWGSTTHDIDKNILGDFNGDGLDDWIYFERPVSPPHLIGYATTPHASSDTNIYLRLSNGSGFDAETQIGTYQGNCVCSKKSNPFAGPVTCLIKVCSFDNYVQVLDINGDNKQDLIVDNTIRLANGTGFDPAQTYSGTYTHDYSGVGDFNGDGKDDLVYKSGLGLYFRPSNGTTFGAATYIDALFQYPGSTKTFVGDYSGDGRDDVLTAFELSTQPTIWNSRISKGNTSFNEIPFYADAVSAGDNVIHFKDLAGSGVDDLVRTYAAIVQTPLYNYNPFSGVATGSDTPLTKTRNPAITIREGSGLAIGNSVSLGAYNSTQYCNKSYNTVQPTPGGNVTVLGGFQCHEPQVGVGDVNGDAIADVVLFDESGFSGASVRITQTPGPIVIKKITEGYSGTGEGTAIEFNYATLQDPNVYTPGSGAVFPDHDLSASVHGSIVSQVLVDNGIGGQLSTSYKYKGCRVNFHGHGNLGFEEVTEIDDATGIETTTYSRQDYPFIGEVYKTETKLQTGQPLSVTEIDLNDFDIKGTLGTAGSYGAGEPIYPYIKKQTERAYDLLDHQLITTVVTETALDDYGNALTVSVTTTDNDTGNSYNTTTVNEYDNIDNQPEKWHLGRLTKATVTKTGGVADPGDAPSNATRVSEFTYDAGTGFLLTETIEPGLNSLTKTYQHDSYGNRKQVSTTGAGLTGTRITKTTYDANGRFPIYAENAKGPTHSETREYNNPWGGVTKLTGPNNLDTVWQYDAQGRKVREVRADGTETNIFYNWCNNSCVDPNAVYKVTTTTTAGATSVAYFDKLGRETLRESESFNGSSVFVTTEYDHLGRTERVSQPHSGTVVAWTTYQYDVLDRVKQEDSAVTGTTTSVYDGLSITITALNSSGNADAQNQVTVETKNGLGWTLSTTDNGLNTDVGVPGVTTFQYDSHGNLRFVTDQHSNVTENRYTIRGFKRYMDDPDMGEWTYEYNVLGELTKQTDEKDQVVDMKYDVLGRLIERDEPEGKTTWVYDTAANGIGKLASESQDGGLSRTYEYDSLGRPTDTTTTIGGTQYISSVSYDSVGRVDTNTYPETNFKTQNIYNAVGFLEKVRKADGNCTNYWSANYADDYGNITMETLGNGAITMRDFEDSTGRLFFINTVTGAGTLQDLRYEWDDVGNLKKREDIHSSRGYVETFLYDGLNRLISADYNGVGNITKTFEYDSIGNILTKSDVENGATYNYGANNAGPHAVTSVGSKTYDYDDNGNMITGDGRTIGWSSYNKPISISKNGNTTQFKYGPDRSRYEQNLDEGGITTTTTYLSAMEKIERSNSTVTEYKHFISAGGNTIAIYTERSNNQNDTHYLHRDHIGSIDVITDENQIEIDRLSYDAFGKRRLANWNDGLPSINTNNTRGFTGHEMLDAVGIIHMNGRVYDPTLGRFLSADPHVQAPKNMQSLNRYSYVLNNPLSYTDPSGFFFSKLFKKIKRAIKRLVRSIVRAVKNFIKKYGRTIVAIAIVAIAPYAGVNAYVAGFASGLVASGGDIKTALVSAATAGLSAPGGALSKLNGVASFAAKAVVGGVASVIQGGKFVAGAIGSAVGGAAEIGTSFIKGLPSFLKAAIVGGTISVVSGGKFANGAITASLVYAVSTSFARGKGKGEWIFPEGGSGNLNDYTEIYTNGILTSRESFVDTINQAGVAGYYNPSQGPFRDILESFGQKIFGWAGDPLAAGFADGLAGVTHPVTIIAHSQGTLTVANASLYYGIPKGSTLILNSPAQSRLFSKIAASASGANLKYNQNFGDIANIYSPSLNPAKFASGIIDVVCGACVHTSSNKIP